MKGGKERRLLELLRYFDSQDNVKIMLILLKDIVDYPLAQQLNNTEIVIYKRKIKKDPSIFFRIYKLVKRFKPDIIHSWGAMPSVYVSPISFFQKIPLLNAMVADCNFPFMGKNWRRAKITFPFSDYVLSNSYAGLTAYQVPYKKGYVIYNGVHLDRFKIKTKPKDVRQKYDVSTKFVVGMVAAFHPRKDYSTLIKAALRIISRNDNVTFLLIGEGILLNIMKNLVPDKMKNKILFLGKLDYVEEVINIFDIGVLTGYTEGLSNSILEYMALGKPVVTNGSGGNPEIVDNNFNGYIVPTQNIDEMVNKIEVLLSDDLKRIQFGKNAKEKVMQGFSIDIMANSYLNLYHLIIDKHQLDKVK